MPTANPPDAFYFRYDRDAVTFTFEFLATINGVPTTIVKNAILQNELPSLTTTRPCPVTETWNCGDVTYPLYQVSAINGSVGVVTGQANQDFISSYTVTASDGTDYTFSFTTVESTVNGELVVTFGFNGSATVPDGDYDVAITFTDAGPAEVTCNTVLTVNNECCRTYFGIFPADWPGGQIGYTSCDGESQSTVYPSTAAGSDVSFCSKTVPVTSPSFTLQDFGSC